MPSEAVIAKAAQALKGNLVQLAGTARYYDIGLGDDTNRVYINASAEGGTSWNCTCENGKHQSIDNQDVDGACYHVVAALHFDSTLMERVNQQRQSS